MKIDPEELTRHAAYSLFISTLVPRPIAFVSTLSTGGRPNLAPSASLPPRSPTVAPSGGGGTDEGHRAQHRGAASSW
jgi:flavin reductase (DIM6/NTAB) family NADH-FMN oxidoreductase RutF